MEEDEEFRARRTRRGVPGLVIPSSYLSGFDSEWERAVPYLLIEEDYTFSTQMTHLPHSFSVQPYR